MAATLAARRWVMPLVWGLLLAAAVVAGAATWVLTSARCLATSAVIPSGACGSSWFERLLLAASATVAVAGAAGFAVSLRRLRERRTRTH